MEPHKDKDRSKALAGVVGRNLHELRIRHDLTLEGLARISGVSRAMLWQIERARSAPTITVLSRVAGALGVPVTTFLAGATPAAAVVLRRLGSRIVQTEGGTVSVRALFPNTGSRSVEFHEMRLEAGAVEHLDGRREGTFENVVVSEGSVQVEVGAGSHLLSAGDAIYFHADVRCGYRNVTHVPALLYIVTMHPSPVAK